MRNTQNTRRSSARHAAVLAFTALSIAAIGGPVAAARPAHAAQARAPQTLSEDAPARGELRLPVEARGNWMREYVQLRVAQQNLRFADEPLTEN